MRTPRTDHQVYQRRCCKKVHYNAEENSGNPKSSVPVTPSEPKPLLVYARRRQQPGTNRSRAEAADSAAMNILVGKFSDSIHGQEKCGNGAGITNLLDALNVDDAALAGISFTQLLNSSIAANPESFSSERRPTADRGDKEDYATCSTNFDANEARHNTTMREDPFSPSTPLHSHNVHKIHRVGIDLNKTPRQRPKKKTHATPKILIEGKPVKTPPKPKTRENGSSSKKRKYVRRDIVQGLLTPAVEESTKKCARRGGVMDSPITPFEDTLKGYSDPSSESPLLHRELMSEHDNKVSGSPFEGDVREKSCKRFLNFDDEGHLQDTKPNIFMTLPVHNEDFDLNFPPQEFLAQSRVFRNRLNRRSQCLIRSREIGPNIPSECKRRRNKRGPKEMFVRCPCFPKNFKRKRSTTTRRCRANVSGLSSFISELVHDKQRRLAKRKPSKRVKIKDEVTNAAAKSKRMKNKLMHDVPEEQMEAFWSKDLEYITARLMRLSIKDEVVGAIVPYKPKQKTPKVLLDSETMRVWNQLMMLEGSTDGGDPDGQNEEKWEQERIKFRERVENFTAHMHMILGDRRFSPWKGSVVDSVVGVFLTQNVSDYLSSSAFMALWAKFPLKSQNEDLEEGKYDECSESIPINAESVGPSNDYGAKDVHETESEVDDGIITAPSRLDGESSGVGINLQETPSILTEPINLFDVCSSSPAKENQLEQEGSSTSLPSSCLSQESSSSDLKLATEKKDSSNAPADSLQSNQETSPRTTTFEGTSEQNHVKVDTGRASPNGKKKSTSQKEKKKVDPEEWERMRRIYRTDGPRNKDHMDSVDWEAVRCAKLEEVAETIRERGQHYIIASRIQEFLTGVLRLHDSIDLEWLRNCPPDKVKDYLLEVNGLGLKSVECVRLLCLQHMAFPVDTNVGRIAVRLGWVPLQPLPDNLQLHLLEKFPIMDEIQKYLWPRLCTLDQRTLYELHYHLITFGKVFCTKKNPNCNSCPLRGDCKHFASAFASAYPLPAPQEESTVTSIVPVSTEKTSPSSSSLLIDEFPSWLESNNRTSNCEPIIEEPATPEPEPTLPLRDIEDLCLYNDADDDDEIPTINLNSSEFIANLCSYMNENNIPIQENSTALVALSSTAASIPLPKLKYVSRLRTEHQVYELPDDHPLLRSLERRETDDPCPYLLAIWPTASSESSETKCKSQISGELCREEGCSSCNACGDRNSETIKGTILIPCRTAMRGAFPLNGTYFQVNEVFADNESSRQPIDVPRCWIWNLRRRIAYFGTSTSTIFRGLSTEKIQYCFWRGFVCVRGFDRKSRAPKPLLLRFHRPTSMAGKGAAAENDDQAK